MKKKNLDTRTELKKILGNKMCPNSSETGCFSQKRGEIFDTHSIEKLSSFIHKLTEIKISRK